MDGNLVNIAFLLYKNKKHLIYSLYHLINFAVMKLQVKSYTYLIDELRSRLNLNQAELALKLGISYPSLSRWRNGHHQPSPMAIALLKQAVVDLGDRG